MNKLVKARENIRNKNKTNTKNPHSIIKFKNVMIEEFNSFKSRLDCEENRISNLEERIFEITQLEEQK